MLGGRNLVVDTFSEVYDLLKPWITHDFWDFATHEIVANSVYVICRKQFNDNIDQIRAIIARDDIVVFFENAAEGSSTLVGQLHAMNLTDVAKQHTLLLLGGGDMEDSFSFIHYDHFLIEILNYNENHLAAQRTDEIYNTSDKPYSFLFLNGRARPHRKYLYEKLKKFGLLDSALWTMLDTSPAVNRHLRFEDNGINLLATQTPVQLLPAKYEVDRYQSSIGTIDPASQPFVKSQLFGNEWGEVYIQPQQFIDTYFSLVTETVFDYPHSFRTEKIARPLMMGHPWIVASNAGYYRDIRNLGFRTFSHVIDESFDQISNHQDRMNRILDTVQDLCCSDLTSFLMACQDVCKYNQQHLQELVPHLRSDFPRNFFNLVNQHG